MRFVSDTTNQTVLSSACLEIRKYYTISYFKYDSITKEIITISRQKTPPIYFHELVDLIKKAKSGRKNNFCFQIKDSSKRIVRIG